MVTMAEVEALIDQKLIARPNAFNPEKQDQLEYAYATLQTMTMDQSLGRVLGGSLWLSGVSVLDGTITADKLVVNTLEAITVSTGALNVTDTITMAPSYPYVSGERARLTASGFFANNSLGTQTVAIRSDGSGQFGNGATAWGWTTAGVVTIPVAAIGSLTIGSVGSGILGGEYASASTGIHMKLSTAGIYAWNATSEVVGNETFSLNAATGSVRIVGSFTVLSTATGAHVKIDNAGGIAGYSATTESVGNRTFFINAATGAGNLGAASGSNQGISWDSSGVVSIGGATFSGGKIVASSLSVSTLSAISADLGTITAGTITAASFYTSGSTAHAEMTTAGISSYNSSNVQTAYLANNGSGWVGYNGTTTAISWTTAGLATINASRIVTGSLAFGSSGTVNSTGTVSGTLGGLNLANLTVTGDITVGSGGKIKFGSSAADYLDDNILHFEVGSTESARIEFLNSSNAYRSRIAAGIVASTTSALTIGTYNSASSMNRFAGVTFNSGTTDAATSATFTAYKTTAAMGSEIRAFANGTITVYVDDTAQAAEFRRTNRALHMLGRIYPGDGTTDQASVWIASNGTYLDFQGPVNFGNATVGGGTQNWSAGALTATSYVKAYINGSLRRIPYYQDA